MPKHTAQNFQIPQHQIDKGRTEAITLYCSPAEKALLQRAADIRAGGSINTYLLGMAKYDMHCYEKGKCNEE